MTAVVKIILIGISLLLQAFKGLYENASNNAHVDAHLAILSAIRDVSKLVVKELTSWVCATEFYFLFGSSLQYLRHALYNNYRWQVLSKKIKELTSWL